VSFLLDTNICSAYLKRRTGLTHRFVQHSGHLYLPTIVLGELYTWAFRRAKPEELLAVLQHDLLADLTVIDFDRHCARQFGQLQSLMLTKGTVVNSVDLMIAAVAVVNDLTVVTHNTRHFEPVPGLRVVDWLQE
jgi:tRNA(fMet)-specific endonuclease VapC